MIKTNNYTWLLPFTSNQSWIDSFHQNFDSEDITLIADIEDDKPTEYSIASIHIDAASSDEQRNEIINTIIPIINAAMMITYNLKTGPFNPEYTWSQETGRKTIMKDTPTKTSPFISTNTTHRPAHVVAKIISMAKTDATTMDLLRYIGYNNITWISLYAALDFMKQNHSLDQLCTMSSIPKNQVNLFTHTANNHEATGVFCRHGATGNTPPKAKLTLEDAANHIIFPIVRSYLKI